MARRLIVEWVAPGAVYTAITVALMFPLIRMAGAAFPHDAGDPALNTWLLWWSTVRLPLTDAWWDAPMFYPMAGVMALSELLIGLVPITAPIQWASGNALLAYNTAFLLSFVLSGLAAHSLAFHLTGRRDAAMLAGLAFAFGPYRMNQLSHLQVLSYYWAPVALLGLHRYVDGSRRVWLVVFGAAWLIQSLSNGYALFHLSTLIVLWIAWFVRDRRTLLSIGAAWLLASLPLVPVLLRYRQVHDRLHLERDINEIQRFSSDIAGFFSAPPASLLWGGRLLPSQVETALFPGIAVLVLLATGAVIAYQARRRLPSNRSPLRTPAAVVAAICVLVAASAVVFGPWTIGPILTVSEFRKPFSIAVLAGVVWLMTGPWWRRLWSERSVAAFYVASAVVLYLLAFGPSPTLLGRPILYEAPYAWLMRLPGFDVLRVPARFAMLALLCQAIVVALAFARWMPSHAGGRVAAACVFGLGIVADGWIRLPLVTAPQPIFAESPGRAGSPWAAVPGAEVRAVVELPAGEPVVDFPALYRSMSHRLPVVNGFSGFAPPHYLPFVYAIAQGQLHVLHEIAANGPVAVLVDRALHWHTTMEAGLATLPGTRRLDADDRWAAYVVNGLRHPPIELGPRLAPRTIRANRQEQDVARLSDGRIESAWGPGTPQDGREEVVVEFESPQVVTALVLDMGPYAFGFPRNLAIDVSVDGSQWTTVWQSETSVATVRAALADPENVPLTFDLGTPLAKIVRLRQVGRDDAVPWWIAELHLHGT
jgi:hypothetical protein